MVSLLTAWLLAAGGPNTGPTVNDLIEQLAADSHAARSRASTELRARGRAAELALRRAARSGDPEAARRARRILADFDWGIYPDTPPAVARLLRQYRDGRGRSRRAALTGLLDIGAPARRAMEVIWRKSVRAGEGRIPQIEGAAAAAFRQALDRDDPAATELILDFAARGGDPEAVRDYALFHHFAGTAGRAAADWVGRFKRSKADPDRSAAGRIAVRLLRAAGDDAAAAELARGVPDAPGLLDRTLWAVGDWAGLAELAGPSGLSDVERLSYRLGVARIAGRDDLVEEFESKMAALTEADTIATGAMALARGWSFNGRQGAAEKVLRGHPESAYFLFEMLRWQCRFGEAFALLKGTPREGLSGSDAFRLRLVEARLRHRLGQYEQSKAMFDDSAAGLRGARPGDTRRTRLIEAAVMLGRRAWALDITTTLLKSVPRGQRGGSDELAEAVPAHRRLLGKLWAASEQAAPSWTLGERVRRLADLLDGRAGERFDEWAGPLAEASAGDYRALHAVGRVYAAAGRLAKAEDLLRRSVAKLPYPDTLVELAEVQLRRSVPKPPFPDTAPALGEVQLRRGQNRAAAASFLAAWRKSPQDAMPLYLHGWALIRAGDRRAGLAAVRRSRLAPLLAGSARLVNVDAFSYGGWAEETAVQTRAILATFDPETYRTSRTQRRGAMLALRAGRYAECARLYRRSMLEMMRAGSTFYHPGWYAALPARVAGLEALAQIAAGEYEAGLAGVDAFLKRTPTGGIVVGPAVRLLTKAGRHDDADRLFRKTASRLAQVLKEYPQSAYYHRIAASLRASCRRDLDAALRHARRAAELHPDYAFILSTLAEVHFQRGGKAPALAAINRAVRLRPRTPYYRQLRDRIADGDQNAPLPIYEYVD